MDLFKYIKYNGEYTFKELEFNEIDNVIFSLLAYVDLEEILIGKNSTIEQIGNKYFETYTKKQIRNNISEIRTGIKVLKYCMNTIRYKDIIIENYAREINSKTQFKVISFKLSDDLIYIAYEGTDHYISGWEEDCQIFYKFPVKAQKFAISFLDNYLNKEINIIIGGHSKGGNLAVISSMYTNKKIKSKIKRIYSNDGLGIRKEQFESKEYKSIRNKIIRIIPDYSIIGLLLYVENYIVVKSSKKNFFAHNPSNWIIKNDKFIISKLSKFSLIFKLTFTSWLDIYSDYEKEKFVNCIFDICRTYKIKSLHDFKRKKRLIFKIMKESQNIDNDVKLMFRQFMIIFKNYYFNKVV